MLALSMAAMLLVAGVGPQADSAPISAVVVKATPVFVLPDASRPPLRIAAEGSKLNVIRDEGDWLMIEFRDPQWGRRTGYVQKKDVAVHPQEPEMQPMDLSVTDGEGHETPTTPQSQSQINSNPTTGRPVPGLTRLAIADLRAAAEYGGHWASPESFLDAGLKDRRVKLASLWAVDGTSKFVTFLTDWTTVAAAAAGAHKDGRILADAELQRIPQGGLLHAIVEIHARGMLNTGPAAERYASGRAQLLLKVGNKTLQPIDQRLVTERAGMYFPLWTYAVGTYGNVGWAIAVSPGAITRKVVLNFTFLVDPADVSDNGHVVLIDAGGKKLEGEFDFRKLR